MTLIARLNDDLAHEYAAVIRYRTYASLLRGPRRAALRRLFAQHAAVELAHATLLADKIAALGGLPTVGVAPVEHATEPEAMLRRLSHAASAAVGRYVLRRRLAETIGEHGLAVDPDGLVADETRHRDELTQLLGGPRSATDTGSFDGAHDRGVRTRLLIRNGVAAYAAAAAEPGARGDRLLGI